MKNRNLISLLQKSSKNLLLLLVTMGFGIHSTFAQDPFVDPMILDTPIDGGLSLLIAAAVAYGSKKAYDSRKKKKTEGQESGML